MGRLEYDHDHWQTRSEDSTGRLMYHLHNTARLLIPSVVADNASSVRYAHDVLCLWFNQSRFTRYWEEEYRWHSFFLTPDYLSLKRQNRSEYVTQAASIKKMPLCPLCCKCLIRFAVVNGRYLIAHFESQKNIDLADLVNHLIMSELYEDRDTHDTLTPAFRRSVDIIDMILRIEHCNLHTNTSCTAGYQKP
ncbi:hypothetical protein [Escherichia coli]|uniref:hypothetical protein n=1 Tax=Escherichia coli TaxID=562 RepID=UPI00201CC930|nr:hypothetical protein [Escherichia coli]